MYQRILVAIDNSDTSDLVLWHAVTLAKDQRAQLRIAHAVDSIAIAATTTGGFPVDATPLFETLRENGRAALEKASTSARSAGVQAECVLLEDEELSARVATLLMREAKRWGADLIAIGTHGRRGFDRLLLGSVAETLIRTAPVPILLVRATPNDR